MSRPSNKISNLAPLGLRRLSRNSTMRPQTLLSLCVILIGIAVSPAADQQKKRPTAPKPGAEYKPTAADLAAENLIPNGNFEDGEITPDAWQSIDNLSAFWVQDEDPAHGKVLKFNTDILQTQAYEWWKEIASGASPKDA